MFKKVKKLKTQNVFDLSDAVVHSLKTGQLGLILIELILIL